MKVSALVLACLVLVASKKQAEKQTLRDVLEKLCELEEDSTNYKSILVGAGIGLAALPGQFKQTSHSN